MSDSEEPVCKRRKIEDDSNESNSFSISLLHFPDDLLLTIFSLVDPPDLLALSKTCERFNNISYDKSLWEKVDIRRFIITHKKLKKFSPFLQPSTKLLATRGPGPAHLNATISKSFLRSLKETSPNLKTLVLDSHIIDTTKVVLDDFPESLECLSLINCDLKNLPTEKSYFYRLEKILPKLKTLDLSNNGWFVPHSLLALSKSPTLQNLNLKGCELSDCLPYASLAANFGFNALQCLDLRKTCISDIEVTCFNRTVTLRHLYLCASDPQHAEAQVTDYSITTFGGGARDGHGPLNIDGGVIIIEIGSISRPTCNLETLVVKNYPGITDITLRHATLSMKQLKYLDVTGTGCSEAGILDFKKNRPDVTIIPDIMA